MIQVQTLVKLKNHKNMPLSNLDTSIECRKMPQAPKRKSMILSPQKHRLTEPSTSDAPTPLDIMIKMPKTNQISPILQEINTGALDPEVFNHFLAKEEQECISINLSNSQNTEFCSGFLIALSDTIKGQILSDQEPQEKVSFFIKGEEAASAATCLASCGLWGARFEFENTTQEQLFHQYHEQVVKAIEAGEKELKKQIKKQAK